MNSEERVESLDIALSNRPQLLAGVATEAHCGHRLTGSREAIADSVRLRQSGVRLAGNIEELSEFLSNLRSRCEGTGQMADLEDAIKIARQAVNSTPEDHPDRAACLRNLGSILAHRYERMGQMADLEDAITIARQAVNSTPEDHTDRSACLRNLGNILVSRYERMGQVADLEEALTTAHQAVESMPMDPPDRAACLNNIGGILARRYERTGQMADLEEALTTARQAVESMPKDHPNHADCLNNLGNLLASRYERTGQLADLEDAITTARQAVESKPEDHPSRAGWLSNLGNSLRSRYERIGEIADLDVAITTARQAAESTPENHAHRASRLNKLGIMLWRRYERTRQMADIEEAITSARQAVESTPEDHHDRPNMLNNLAVVLWGQHQRKGEMADLEEAITTARQAVESTPKDHANHAARLNNIGNMLVSRYERTGQMVDLEDAITSARQAVESTPEDHHDRAACLTNLGIKLRIRFICTGRKADLDETSDSLYAAWHCTASIPFLRVNAGAQCLNLLIAKQEFVKASELGRDIIGLMPAVSTKLLDRNDQQAAISTFAGVASNLCAILLEIGRHEDALLYLEQGRAFIIGQLIDRQRDISDLALNHPDIARRYENLLREVNAPMPSAENDSKRHRTSERRSALVDEMMACIADIRTLPGHERFLLGQTVAEMKETAEDGNIVIINIAHSRTDAIIVSATNVETFPLPGLSADRARVWLSKDWTVHKKYKGRRAVEENRKKNDEFVQYLEWLWQDGVELILSKIQNHSQEDPGRVWWIGSGLAATMPFHAAGEHTTADKDSACHVVSSYTPSIKALAFSRSKAMRATEGRGSLLVATMENTPKARDAKKAPAMLPGVDEERRAVLVAARGRLRVHDLPHPSADQVLAGLQDCSIAHLACHGHTDSKDPSKSHLILQKGGETGLNAEQDLLTVHLVSKLKLDKARLAYLSACSTAQNSSKSLSDEVIHVVSGFQVAGFPHVVGCLWPADDGACVEVAGDFYKRLLEQPAWWEGDHVAKAIQSAVMKLREQWLEMPLIWAPFVHYGA